MIRANRFARIALRIARATKLPTQKGTKNTKKDAKYGVFWGGSFHYKIGDFFEILTQAYPPGGVIYIYIYQL